MDFSRATILCLGDVMLDRFAYCDTERISPEAPVPVLLLRRTQSMLGGAGNVARNTAALGGTAVLIGLSPAGETAEVDLPRLFTKRARVLTSHGGDHLPQEDFPRLAQWALEGKLDLAGMVTRRIALDEAPRALDELRSSPDLIRSVIVL